MTLLQDAKQRSDALAILGTAILSRTCSDHVERALVLAENMLAQLTAIEVYFAQDEMALHHLVGAAAIVKQLIDREDNANHSSRAETLFKNALALRIQVLCGEDVRRERRRERKKSALSASGLRKAPEPSTPEVATRVA